MLLLDDWSTADHGRLYAELDDERQAALRARLQRELRRNTYDRETQQLRVSPDRARAIQRLSRPDGASRTR